MSDSFDENGLQVATRPELLETLTQEYQAIYGEDINVDQSSPDGQALNIFAQGGTDIRELLVQIYNSFDPDACSGAILDARCALNNVFRKGGTFTTVPIDVITDRTVTLEGLDENYNDPNATGYTIQDSAGNQFILVSTQTLQAGTHRILFRAKELGAVQTTLNTIKIPVTIVLGVVSVNNPVDATEGKDEETDYQLKVRRRQSVSIGSSGYLNGLLATVLQLDGVTDAALYENYTNETDANGTPPHCMWLVVEGGSDSEIADAIYRKKSYGCDMRGNIEYTITTISYQQFVAKWDEPTIQNLYIKFNIVPTSSLVQFDIAAIKQFILNAESFKIGTGAETSSITGLAQQAIDANGGHGYAVGVLISTDGSNWVEYIAPVVATKLAIADIDITVEGESS